jgi:hypothetical protein
MRVSKDGTTVLIENPLTGNTGVAEALGLEAAPGVPKWATPDVGREAKGVKWSKANKIVLVRDPEERFNSGATLARLTGISEDNPEAFNEWVAGVETDSNITTGPQWARALLEYIKDGGEVPTYLLPQTGWLKAHYTLVLATHDIATYFNYEVRGNQCCHRLNKIASLPANREQRVHVGADHEVRALLLDVYKEDVALFKKLRVWWHNSEEVRQVSGICVLCSQEDARNADGSRVEVVDLTKALDKDSHASAKPAPRKRASKRKRTSKPVDNTGAGE